MKKFQVIPNEQTPKVDIINNNIQSDIIIREYIKKHEDSLDDFLEFILDQENAAGLAANQVSIDGIRFMVRAFALKNLDNNMWSIIINPIIKEYIGINEMKTEGCLTWKGRKIIANRYRAVKVEYYDFMGNKHIETYKGFVGQIWQHEINHLNGIPETVVENNYPNPQPLKIGRNDPCPCLSGKKYKKCCLLLI